MALKFRKFLINLSEKGRETLNVRAVFRETAIDIKKKYKGNSYEATKLGAKDWL